MRALVLSGGSVRGAFQIGVLEELICNQKLDYSIFCGTSVGAINCASLASAPEGKLEESLKKLKQTWFNIGGNSDIRNYWKPLYHLMGFWKKSIYDSSPLQRLIKSNIDEEGIKTSGRILRVGAVSYTTGEYFECTEQTEDLWKWVCASAATPGILSPIEINGQLWMDGGVKNITPLLNSVRAGASEIDVILTEPLNKKEGFSLDTNPNSINILRRAYDVMSGEFFERDIHICDLYNKLATADPNCGRKNISFRVFAPEYHLTRNSLNFNPKKIREFIEHGLAVAKK